MLTSKTPWKDRASRSMSERSAECFTEIFWNQWNVFVKKRNIITFEQMFLAKLIVKTIGNHWHWEPLTAKIYFFLVLSCCMWQKHIDIQLPEKHPGAGDYGRDVHFGESDLQCLADFEFNKYYWELTNIIQNHHFLFIEEQMLFKWPKNHWEPSD